MRNVWLLLALTSLLHVLPQTAALSTIALTACVTALTLAFAGKAVVARPGWVAVRVVTATPTARVARVSTAGRAGRPQPRAPGCGR